MRDTAFRMIMATVTAAVTLIVTAQTDRQKTCSKINQSRLQLQCHSIAIQRRPVLRPEISLTHRPTTGINILSYKLTVLSIYSNMFDISTIKKQALGVYSRPTIQAYMRYMNYRYERSISCKNYRNHIKQR